jgi:hypothetical protein
MCCFIGQPTKERKGTYQRDNICQRTKQYAESPLELNLLNSLYEGISIRCKLLIKGGDVYYFGNVVPVQLDITYALPVQIQIQFDTLSLGLVDIYIGEADRDVSEVELDEAKVAEGAWKSGGENGFLKVARVIGCP